VTEEMRQKARELVTLPRWFYGFLLGHYAGYNAGGAMSRCNLGRPDIYIVPSILRRVIILYTHPVTRNEKNFMYRSRRGASRDDAPVSNITAAAHSLLQLETKRRRRRCKTRRSIFAAIKWRAVMTL
jgi:hypothetical protein